MGVTVILDAHDGDDDDNSGDGDDVEEDLLWWLNVVESPSPSPKQHRVRKGSFKRNNVDLICCPLWTTTLSL